jgi:hypothetical protein
LAILAIKKSDKNLEDFSGIFIVRTKPRAHSYQRILLFLLFLYKKLVGILRNPKSYTE